MERTIKVTGKGKISVKPDTIRLIITQTNLEKTYEGAIMESAGKKGNLNEALKRLGFEKDALKTLFFNIDTDYENYRAKDKSWKRRLAGYRYTHTRPVNELMLRECYAAPTEGDERINLDIEADNIDVTDTVTVVWEIG